MTRGVEPIQAHAAESLRFIRDAMSRASEFTALPGWGGVAMGATALVAAMVSGPPDNSLRWMMIWFADAMVAAAIGLVAIARKAQRAGTPLSTAAPARRFALAYAPPLVAGMILTPVFASLDLAARLPGCWLLLYGTAVATGGALSIRIVPLVGVSFIVVGTGAFAAPAAGGHYFLAAGVGGPPVVFCWLFPRGHRGLNVWRAQ